MARFKHYDYNQIKFGFLRLVAGYRRYGPNKLRTTQGVGLDPFIAKG